MTDHRWETGQQLRRVGSVADQVRAGGVDLVVIFQQFTSHTVSEQLVPACKSTDGVSMVWVESGYGSSAVGVEGGNGWGSRAAEGAGDAGWTRRGRSW